MNSIFRSAICIQDNRVSRFVTFVVDRMLFGGEWWKLGDELPGRGMLAFFGLITGLFSSLVGVSRVQYRMPFSPFTNGGCIRRWVHPPVGVPITIAGAIGYTLAGWPHMAQLLSIGFVSLVGFMLMAPVSSCTTSYGACAWRIGDHVERWKSPSTYS
jgi:hypothetical protein